MTGMDAPHAKLHFAALVVVQDGSTGELGAHYGEKFLKITIFENFTIAILDPLAPHSVENGQLG